MQLQDINWKDHARAFCREHNEMNVPMIEKAMKEGARLVIGETNEVLASAIKDLSEARRKANAPQ